MDSGWRIDAILTGGSYGARHVAAAPVVAPTIGRLLPTGRGLVRGQLSLAGAVGGVEEQRLYGAMFTNNRYLDRESREAEF
jgi:hypothetical protein